MRKKIFVFLLVMGVSVLGLRLVLGEKTRSQNPPGQEIQLVKHGSFNQLNVSDSPLVDIQNAVDSISDAARQNKWNSASRAIQQLNETWQPMQESNSNYLTSEDEITTLIQSLNYNVWAQDQEAVLSTAHKLTLLISQLTR